MYIDEKVIKARNEAKKDKYYTIDYELTINGNVLSFSKKELFNSLFSIVLPDQFIIMDSEVAKTKYPSEFRPKLIYTNENGDVNFTFSYLDSALHASQINTMIEDLQAIQKRLNPANVFLETGSIKSVNRNVGFFTFRSYCFDDDIYNTMFITNINDLLLLGSFNCMYSQRYSWEPLVKQMIATINDLG